MMETPWLQRLAKWRNFYTGWQLGTRLIGDPESDALRDHREVTMLLRAEVNALTHFLITKGGVSVEEFTKQLEDEARHLCEEYSQSYPGFVATDDGMQLNLPDAADTMKRMNFLP